MAQDDKLWKVFSEFIRKRDSDNEGIGKCFTCNTRRHWREADAGHGIGRQHKSVKYDERNVHLQCKRCNGFEGGQQAIYKEEVDKRYGEGTWQKLVIKSKETCKRGKFEIDEMTKYYREQIKLMNK